MPLQTDSTAEPQGYIKAPFALNNEAIKKSFNEATQTLNRPVTLSMEQQTVRDGHTAPWAPVREIGCICGRLGCLMEVPVSAQVAGPRSPSNNSPCTPAGPDGEEENEELLSELVWRVRVLNEMIASWYSRART